jgi:hypothetical protein
LWQSKRTLATTARHTSSASSCQILRAAISPLLRLAYVPIEMRVEHRVSVTQWPLPVKGKSQAYVQSRWCCQASCSLRSRPNGDDVLAAAIRGSVGNEVRRIESPTSYPPFYRPSFIQSATRSAIMIVVVLVLARMTSGITEASTTLSPSTPCTWQNWSTTASGSEAGPILHVPVE